jgi:hypothetical protein
VKVELDFYLVNKKSRFDSDDLKYELLHLRRRGKKVGVESVY